MKLQKMNPKEEILDIKISNASEFPIFIFKSYIIWNKIILYPILKQPFKTYYGAQSDSFLFYDDKKCLYHKTATEYIILPCVGTQIQQVVITNKSNQIVVIAGFLPKIFAFSPPLYNQAIFLYSLNSYVDLSNCSFNEDIVYLQTYDGSLYSLSAEYEINWTSAVLPLGYKLIDENKVYEEKEGEYDDLPLIDNRDRSNADIDCINPAIFNRSKFAIAYNIPNNEIVNGNLYVDREEIRIPSKEEMKKIKLNSLNF